MDIIICGFRLAQNVGSRKEVIANVPMGDACFTDRFIMKRTDFISIDLWEDLPVGGAKVLPLSLSAFGAITKLFGFCTTIVVHSHKEPVSGIG